LAPFGINGFAERNASGFGRSMSWKEDEIVPQGHQLSFKNALHIVSSNVFLKLVVPNFALGLTEKFRNIRLAFNELEVRLNLHFNSRLDTYNFLHSNI
jgi:hypothetical protein